MKKHILLFAFGTVVIYLLTYLPHLPIPLDTIQGLYHPMRDIQTDYSRGIPVKNPLITDPVRQQFPWKMLIVDQFKNGHWPLWNPYNFSGTPLLANIQSGAFYPGNLIFFTPYFSQGDHLLTFARQWSLYIYLQTILFVYFFYLYIRVIGVRKIPSVISAIAWGLCGYNLAWWQWGNIGHTILYFPLILWSIEKIIVATAATGKIHPFALSRYHLIFIFSISSSFLAGHWQSFFYVAINTFFYLLYRTTTIPIKNNIIGTTISKRMIMQWSQFTLSLSIFLLIIAVQLLPSLEFIGKSDRALDTKQWQRIDWFFPYEHLIGLISPDFFGNPSTNNYWGVWNYGEFSSYVGLIILICAFAIIIKYIHQKVENLLSKNHSRENSLDMTESSVGVGFFLFCLLINLFFITRNPLAELPFIYQVPFLSTAQPSRGVVMVDFSLIVLGAVSLSHWQNSPKTMSKYLVLATLSLLSILALLWGITLTDMAVFSRINSQPSLPSDKIAQRNLILPTLISLAFLISITITSLFNKKNFTRLTIVIFFLLNLSDMSRNFLKFNTWSDAKYLYPSNEITTKIQSDLGRYMTLDSRLMAPNINTIYKIPAVDGYDPLYFDHYGKFIALWVRNEPDLTPFPANRIITPHTYSSIFTQMSGVRYILSFDNRNELCQDNEKDCALQFGDTRLYANPTQSELITFKNSAINFTSEQQLADHIFSGQFNPGNQVLLLSNETNSTTNTQATASAFQILEKSPNKIMLQASVKEQESYLYIAQAYDQGWKAYVGGKQIPLLRANLSFQALRLSQGDHQVLIKYLPDSFILGGIISIIGVTVTILLSLYSHRQGVL